MTDDPREPDPADDLSQYRQMYLDETEEQLDDLIETMLVLERDPGNADSLNSAFRLLHSMKGAAGMMGFDQITVLTHHLETRFERLRSGRIELDAATMNLTLRCLDFLRECNDRIRAGNELGTPDVLLGELRELEEIAEDDLRRREAADAIAPPAIPDDEPAPAAEPPAAEPPAASQTPAVSSSNNGDETSGIADDYHLVIDLHDRDDRSAAAHSALGRIAGLGPILATRPERDDLNDELAGRLDVIVRTGCDPDTILADIIGAGITRIEVRVPRDNDSPPLAVHVANETVDSKRDGSNEGRGEAAVNVTESVDSQPGGRQPTHVKSPETMRVEIDRLDRLMNLAGELVVNRARFVQVVREYGPQLRKSGTITRLREFCDILSDTVQRVRVAPPPAGTTATAWSLQLDELVSGLELVQHQTRSWESQRQQFGQFEEAVDQLTRVSSSMQQSVLDTRMVPVGPMFTRFRRVVRDLAKAGNKKVNLVFEGETTELDKRMIDELGDPLIHLVRNSIDHGLESTDQRIAAGKPATGTIRLAARHSGNHVLIRIEDDGCGIDANKIRERIVRRGIQSLQRAERLTDAEAIEHIWHPGFSTATEVTDVSGRGVGMDVVRSRIEDLSGVIDLHSRVGVGTTITLKLPLTLAIVAGLMVRVGDLVFALPMDEVREIIAVERDAVTRVGGVRTIEVRGEFMPLADLNEVFSWHRPPVPKSGDSINVAVLQVGKKLLGLRVDDLEGSQDLVIKSLAENFVGIPGLAGASILGDGSVTLMIDAVAVLNRTTSKRSGDVDAFE